MVQSPHHEQDSSGVNYEGVRKILAEYGPAAGAADEKIVIFYNKKSGVRESTLLLAGGERDPHFPAEDEPMTLWDACDPVFDELSADASAAALILVYSITSSTLTHRYFDGADATEWFYNPANVRDLAARAVEFS